MQETTVPEALHLSPGSKAPDFRFNTPWEGSANFYETIGTDSVVLIFQRYIGCPVCQMEMANLRIPRKMDRGSTRNWTVSPRRSGQSVGAQRRGVWVVRRRPPVLSIGRGFSARIRP